MERIDKMNDLQKAFNEVSAKCADLNAELNAKLTDDNATAEEFQSIKDELTVQKARRDALNDQIKALEDEKPEPVATNTKGADITPKKENKLENQKKAINDFIHSRGAKLTDDAATSVTSTQVEPIIPEEIIYNPESEVNTVQDLSELVTKTPVTTAKGTYPILKRADDSFNTVEELKENPELAAPEFENVDWSVDTYRGAIAISEESIADSQVDLTALVGQNIGEKRVNTVNKIIAPILKGFTAKTSTVDTLVDDLKHILNVDLDQAYTRNLVVTQSMYQILDTLKDKEGQYILHRDITTGSGYSVLGIPVTVVNDNLLGADGEAHAFVGDLARGVLFVDRQEVSLAWMKSEIYGQYLGAAMRFGAFKADENAGYFLSVGTTDGGESGK